MIFPTIVGTVFFLTKNENFRAKLVDIYIWFIKLFFFKKKCSFKYSIKGKMKINWKNLYHWWKV